MKRILYIIASPREEESRSIQISESFLDAFKKKHPDWVVDTLNLFTEDLPSLSQKNVSGKYVLLQGKELFGSLKETWTEILQHIERFKTADFFLISTPMWNFNIPYVLKQYIDLIVQPKYLFRYGDDGKVEGLVKNKRMVITTSRGGEYISDDGFDHQEPYLRTIFNFVGIKQIDFIIAEPMDKDPKIAKMKLEEAKRQAIKMGSDA